MKRGICVERKTIAIDFDSTIHSYTSGWKGATEIPDPPVFGAFEFIEEMLEHFDVTVFTTRVVGNIGARAAIWEWFEKHGMSKSVINNPGFTLSDTKPKALVYIDDRGFRFEGVWPTVDELKAMKPWNKR
jgi:hypothetical protein